MNTANVLDELAQRRPVLWINPFWAPFQRQTQDAGVLDDVRIRWRRYTEMFCTLFDLPVGEGVSSPLINVDHLQHALSGPVCRGRWLLKADSLLPVVGSVKARGAIYELFHHAEGLLARHDLGQFSSLSSQARDLFALHEIVVGSTGNLGLSIGVLAKKLGFSATIHMSVEAKDWKKKRLCRVGCTVIEHAGDYSVAVAAARAATDGEPNTYFVDDERSPLLFSGYISGALELADQLCQRGTAVDRQHPLFVFIPCGVGGAPGGITFGLRHIFGDNVHVFFAEPIEAPCLIARLAGGKPISVRSMGLAGHTEADGLAVSRASEFVAQKIGTLVSGGLTVSETSLLRGLALIHDLEGIKIEPSAAAPLAGPAFLQTSPAGRDYLRRYGLEQVMDNATHVLWATGGALLPDSAYKELCERGRDCVNL